MKKYVFHSYIKDILKFIPHRYPFLLVDRILCIKNNNFIKTLKNITINDPWLQGHFPSTYIFPAILTVECIVQSAVILFSIIYPGNKHDVGFYCVTRINNAKFIKFIVPGDQLIIKIYIIKNRDNVFFFEGIVLVNKIIVCRAKITCAYVMQLK